MIARPYLGKTPRALADKLHVWERGTDMVLAAHFTQLKCGITTTLETVRFQPPARIDFRLVRGPVPHLVESFVLTASEGGTELRWQGELGTDLWAIGTPRSPPKSIKTTQDSKALRPTSLDVAAYLARH